MVFIFTPTWGNDPIGLILFRWVETTNMYQSQDLVPVLPEKSCPNILYCTNMQKLPWEPT